MICSERSPEADKVILGATLEIQRLQREEILEQQLMRQQVRHIETYSTFIFFIFDRIIFHTLTTIIIKLYNTNNNVKISKVPKSPKLKSHSDFK